MRKIIISLLALLATVGVVKAYTVVPGDWLSKIAENANLSLSELVQLNPQIENPDIIYVGDEIYTGGTGDSLLGGTKPFAGSTYNLAGAGISSSDTSMTLTSLTIKQTGQKIADGDLSDTFYLTLEPGNNTKQEIAACTTVTQNANGSATLSGCSRGMSPIYPYTASTTMAFTHGGGSQVIFSDPPQLWAEFTGKSNDEQITGTWGFSKVPTTTDECTETSEFCTKDYIDNSANQGAATSTEATGGIAELATQIEMASSTPWTAVNPHVIQSQYASSTPSDGSKALFVVVTENDGYINQGWLDLTEEFTFSSSTITSLYATNATTTARLIVGTAQPSTNDILFVTGNSYFDGNATTTGSMDIGELCFDGGVNGCFSTSTTLVTGVGSSTLVAANDETHDTTYTPGLRYKTILLEYYIQGYTTDGTNKKIQGHVYYDASGNIIRGANYVCDDSGGDGATCAQATLSLPAPGGSSPTMTIGNNTDGSGDDAIKTTISLVNVSDTSFTVRCVFDESGTANTNNGRCKWDWMVIR